MIIEITKYMASKHCLLFCSTCGTNTKHVLSKSGEFYACQCSSIVDVEYKEDEKEIE